MTNFPFVQGYKEKSAHGNRAARRHFPGPPGGRQNGLGTPPGVLPSLSASRPRPPVGPGSAHRGTDAAGKAQAAPGEAPRLRRTLKAARGRREPPPGAATFDRGLETAASTPKRFNRVQKLMTRFINSKINLYETLFRRVIRLCPIDTSRKRCYTYE